MNQPKNRRPFRGARRRPNGPNLDNRPRHQKEQDRLGDNYTSPVAPKGKLRIIPLGGLEEVGRNCILFEYERDIVIVDLGLQFPEEDTPGVDYSIPNTTYLRGKERNIRGIIITHGHYDHIGGVPHLAHKLGNPPIYGTDLTLALIQKKQEDINPKHKLQLRKVTSHDRLRLGAFNVSFLGLSHNIPASLGVILGTPLGTILHTGDFKVDPEAEEKNRTEFDRIEAMRKLNLLALLSDSTNASRSGKMFTEKEIEQNLDGLFQQADGRMIISIFSSLLSRAQQVIRLAEKHNRKILVEGYSLKSNIEIGQRLGYITAKKGTLISWPEAKQLPSKRLIVMCTGAQGEDRAVLMRIANREHKYLRVEKGDLFVFSSSVVPGNERSVQRLKDGLYREGADVVDSQIMDIHASGHAKSDDLRWFIRTVHPRYFIPVEGNHSFLRIHGKLAVSEGVPKDHVLIADNGQVIEFTRGQGSAQLATGRVTNERVPVDPVFVDGLGVGDISHLVLRDRKHLAADGMVIVIATVQGRTGRLVGKPDVITRGFIQVKSNQHILDELRRVVQRALVDRDPKTPANRQYLEEKVRLALEKVILSRTERQPMILPVVIEV